MSGRLGRYVMVRMFASIALVAVVLLALLSLVELVREARSVQGDYQLVQLLVYLALTTPRRLYDVFPFAALIGALLGLGSLASANELTAMRVAGFGRTRIALRALAAVFLCLAGLAAIAELAIPGLEKRARAERQQALTGQIQHARGGRFWLRDGGSLVRVGYSVWLDSRQLQFGDVLIYELDQDLRPRRVLAAERARHSGAHWALSGVRQLVNEDGHTIAATDSLELASMLRPELFDALVSRPRFLALPELAGTRRLMVRNGLDTSRYDEAFWVRLYYPLNVLAMVLIALPMAFSGAIRRGSGLPVFLGVSIGLLYFVVVRLARGLAVTLPLPMGVSLLAPALLFGALAVWLLAYPLSGRIRGR